MDLFKDLDQKCVIFLLKKSSDMPYNELISKAKFPTYCLPHFRIKTKAFRIDPVLNDLHLSGFNSFVCKHIASGFVRTGKKQSCVFLKLRL